MATSAAPTVEAQPVNPPAMPHPLQPVPGLAAAEPSAVVLAHASLDVGYCQACHMEYNALLRDKRGELEIDCPFWQLPPHDDKLIAWLTNLPASASPLVTRLAETLAHQAGRTEPSCQCPHLLAVGTPHQAEKGKPWCSGGQHVHGPEHGEELCPFPDYATFVFQRSGGHTPVCSADGCAEALRCACPTPEAPHVCPDHALRDAAA